MFAVAGKTTWQIRAAANELMERLGRPVSVLEIKNFIQCEKAELSAKVSKKSIDYVRVTLSTTPGGVFRKFLCPREFELCAGESSKKLFWGLSGASYDGVWRPAESACSSGEVSEATPSNVEMMFVEAAPVRRSVIRADACVQARPASIDRACELLKSSGDRSLVPVDERMTEPEFDFEFADSGSGLEFADYWAPVWSDCGGFESSWW
jgi:hypothetical protein